MLIYTGIGARATPHHILKEMTSIALDLTIAGWHLRSGGAVGADTAFEKGSTKACIYAPATRWRGRTFSNAFLPTPEAFDMASQIHPMWKHLTSFVQALHARNCHQVLGPNLNTPSVFLACWTLGGAQIGGTRTAMVIADYHSIPIFNLATCTRDNILKYAAHIAA